MHCLWVKKKIFIAFYDFRLVLDRKYATKGIFYVCIKNEKHGLKKLLQDAVFVKEC